ncbi:TasA family protein [Salinibacterium sp. PAMC 21357]|uniref:TasA family protein n=1 Tax=Salinibacterium sp. PAMC 21357 TaxID=1112215 RepID=UPI0002896C66|nr:TasA family protein [Salinibacterium sp. PAMC 21357]
MNSSTVRKVQRLDMVNGHDEDSTSPAAVATGGAMKAVKVLAISLIAVSLGLIGTGGTYAFLNSSAQVTPGLTLTAGTAALSVGSQSLSWSNLAPGSAVTGTFTITNTGDVPLTLSATVAATMTPAAAANPFTITVANGVCPASGVPSGTLNSTLAAGATTSACLTVTLPTNALPNAQSVSAGITATISGVQP